ncbi:uncharacterized protein MYCFIDRAFT_210846 [Pseudocercospora fijiensis CIRAD86]|uniref:Uncharacterized protein n=1 Tax=Pseudocercospora fijiensis (strain CIRAD86) TaxID=383855 RepID=M2ZZH1_PSEFD|nr:uncharacterized protein MYCFIDRAFT_210846 [Pseudocercospora fijiensis CIRAD86]EME84304.1 hypothetical protein MYCFIDRAFT_210846 [Pseudocercospora fijiensis CIRAD86]
MWYTYRREGATRGHTSQQKPSHRNLQSGMDTAMKELHPSIGAFSGAFVSTSVTDQATLIEQWARRVALSQEAPQQDLLIASPYLKARSSTASSAHDSGYEPPLEDIPFELHLEVSPDVDPALYFLPPQNIHKGDLDLTSGNDPRASLLSMSINERGYSGVGHRPQTAPGRISDILASSTLSTRANLRGRIKHGSTRISACITDFCRPLTGYQNAPSSTSSLFLRDMLDTFPAPPLPRNLERGTSLPATEKIEEGERCDQPQPGETRFPTRKSTRSCIKGIFKNIKQRLSMREALEPARQCTHRGSVMERGSVIVTPYDVVEWRQNGRSVRYLVSPRLMRDGMLLASQTSLTHG